MTADELQAIVRRLSNQCFVRYWLHWNYPANPEKMAIALYDVAQDKPIKMKELEDKGFVKIQDEKFVYYIIKRKWNNLKLKDLEIGKKYKLDKPFSEDDEAGVYEYKGLVNTEGNPVYEFVCNGYCHWFEKEELELLLLNLKICDSQLTKKEGEV